MALRFPKPEPRTLRDEAIQAEVKKALVALKRRVRKRDGGRCRVCGQTGGDLHHLVPRSLGGRDSDTNCLLLCRKCHQLRHAGALKIGGNAEEVVVVEQVSWMR